MTLRTPNPYRSYQTHLNLQRSKERLAILQDQIGSDKRITRLSDDPTAAALIMDFQSSIARNKMYIKQGETAKSFLKGTEAAINSAIIQMDRLLELGQQGLSEVLGPRGREAIAAEVDVVRTVILDLSNTQEQGKYIFAGTATRTLPFAFTAGPHIWNDPLGNPNAVDYDGNLGAIDVNISPNSSITTNLTGSYVFQGNGGADEDIFIAVTMLRDGLQADDTDMIRQAYENLRAIKDRFNVCLTQVGSRQVQLDNSGMNLGDMNEMLQSIQNTYEAPDYPWVIHQFAAEQTAQEYAYAVLSRMGRNSLFDYLG